MVSKKISETLIDALNKKYQPVDDYGYIIGETTSLREQFVKSTKEMVRIGIAKEINSIVNQIWQK